MATGVATIRVTGNTSEAIAALERLGIKAEETGKKAEVAFGDKLESKLAGVGGMFGRLGTTIGSITGIPLLGEGLSKTGERMAEAETKGQKLGGTLAALGKTALLGAAAGVAAVAVEGIHMADAYEETHSRLEASLKATGTSFDAMKKPISAVEQQMTKLGFSNTQTEDGLAALTVATQKPAEAMKLMGVTADLARFKNLSLADAGTAVAKAMEGNTRPLKQLGIDLPINAKNAESLKIAQENVTLATEQLTATQDRLHAKHKVTAADMQSLKTAQDRLRFAQQQVNDAQNAGTSILDALNQRLGGQSSSYAKTFAGHMATLKAQMNNLGVVVGMAVIPVIEKLAKVVMNVVDWFEKHKTVAIIVASVIGGILVAAIAAYTVGMIQAAVATIAATWPILLIIAAVAGLAVGIYELVSHWKQVWNDIRQWAEDGWKFLDGVWHAIDKDIREAWGAIERFFKQWWPEILGVFTAGIGLVVGLIIQHWSEITRVTTNLWHDVTGFFTNLWHDVTGIVTHVVSDVVGFFTRLPGDVINAVGSLLDDMEQFGEHLIQAVIRGMGRIAGGIGSVLKGAVSNIPVIGGTLAHLFGAGGIVTKPTLGIIGEKGPEMVLPLSGTGLNPYSPGGGVMPLPAGLGGGTGSSVGGVGQTINVYQPVASSDPYTMGAELAWAIRPYLAGAA